MFATINTVTEPKGFFGKLKYNLLPPPVKTEVVQVEDGSRFLRMYVPVVRGKIYWNAVRAATGEGTHTVLLRHGLEVHESPTLKPYRDDRFRSIVTVNSFVKLLSLLPKSRLLHSCAVIDFPAAFAGQLCPLPRACRTITVVTANEEKYAPFVRHCMEQYGCAVHLCSDITKAFAAGLVLLPAVPKIPLAFSRESLVFASRADHIYTNRILTPEGVELPQKYLSLMPESIAPLAFAGALYEYAGVHSLGTACAPAFREHNRLRTYQEVISMLDY